MKYKGKILIIMLLVAVLFLTTFLSSCSSGGDPGIVMDASISSTETEASSQESSVSEDTTSVSSEETSSAEMSSEEPSGQPVSSSKAQKTTSSKKTTTASSKASMSSASSKSSTSKASSVAASSKSTSSQLIIKPAVNLLYQIPSTKEYHRGSCEILIEAQRNNIEFHTCKFEYINTYFYNIPAEYTPCKVCNPVRKEYNSFGELLAGK